MDELVRKINSGKTMLILGYAPAGLGHLRVTDALYDGLPRGVRAVILGAHDRRIAILHRWLSVTAPLRFLMERFQQGFFENLVTRTYRWVLRIDTRLIYEQMLTLVDQQGEKPEEVLVVCTHFGLAHQLGEVKKKLEKEWKIKVKLVVQVTDDSPQQIWYIEEADLIVVPSHKTREKLEAYVKREGMKQCRIEVSPYPVNPKMAKKLTDWQMKERARQVEVESGEEIRVAIPISGAGVGFGRLVKLVGEMYQLSNRFRFWVVTKPMIYLLKNLKKLSGLDYVNLVLANSDRETVNNYDQIFQEKLMAIEITKPSEQAFKALVETDKVGGVIMLFVAPVGRQEYDNIAFLRRHGLIPNKIQQEKLGEMALQNTILVGKEKTKWLRLVEHWRGIRLPDEDKVAARLVWWCIEQGIFKRMVVTRTLKWRRDKHPDELGEDGVEKFWRLVAGL